MLRTIIITGLLLQSFFFGMAQASVYYPRSTPKDIWQALRSSFSLELYPQQKEVKKQIKWIQAHPTYIDYLAKHSTPYIYFILERVKKRQMPGELALLPMIESSYNPFAYSHAGAAGLWQLMPGTGTGLGVRQDWWYDGRRGIHSSTKAALNYLQYLNKFFSGNWTLAIAAYDSGEGTVQRAVRAKNHTNQTASFWSLNLPRETQNYIPRLLALALVIKYPKYYGITLPHVPNEAYFTKIEIDSQIDLTHAAKLAEITYAELIKLNPGHNRWATGPNRTHSLVLPIDKVEIFKENLAKMPADKRVSWQRHLVKLGESLSTIAQKYRTSVKLIKSINKLSSNTIKINQQLLIPSTKKLSNKTVVETQRHQVINHAPKTGPKKIIHIVQPGDTLVSIEKKYYTKAAAIRFWNRLSGNQSLKPGQKLIIWQRRSNAKTYTVKAGDNLSTIAKRHHIDIKKIRQLNTTIHADIIKVNQVLRLS